MNALKDEQDIPIEELLKMYGYNKEAAKEPAEAGGPSQAAEEVEADPEDDEEEEEEGDEGEEKTEVEKAPAEEKEEKEDEVVVTQVQTTNDILPDFVKRYLTQFVPGAGMGVGRYTALPRF